MARIARNIAVGRGRASDWPRTASDRLAFNYGDLPVWDLLFGAFHDPRECQDECGFESPADRRLGAMLAFADVNAPFCGPGSRGAK